ncbi:glucose-1-phosphate thymidylyltransferase RfbA [Amylibacter sp.]|nr:glucose-1-phosphate thymidylyltransferase RfbA [Amylibacter sp.]
MKGIILAGGSGTRLYPITTVVSKQLLPVYDKPMIYYPLATLMLADINEILIITTGEDNEKFIELLGNGDHLGINITYAIQDKPGGLPEAFIIGENFIGNDRVCLILGDNIFHSDRFINQHVIPNINNDKSVIFGYRVRDPERYGVVEIDSESNILSIKEKPKNPKSNYAITGLYIFNSDVCQVAKALTVSSRGELEIVDVIKHYLEKGSLKLEALGRGIAWLDTGTHESLLDASNFIEVLENRQGLKISCIEEIAHQKGWISNAELEVIAKSLKKNAYGEYLMSLLNK